MSMQSVLGNVSVSSAVPEDWHSIDWARVHRTVRKLQIRIAKATQDKDWRKVKSLQRFLTRSFSAKALSVRRVTENQGKKSPGIDGVVWSTPEAKYGAILSLKRRGYRPLPMRRVFIPKSNGKLRPLSIPAMKDRAMQALYLCGLQPVAETLADRNSYGFRPERCPADAIEQCFTALSQKHSAKWVLEGDICGCFDNINHNWLLVNVPMDKQVLVKWLKAGYVKSGQLFPTNAGTPQGGIISPTLANLALDGLEAELERHFGKRRTPTAFKNKVNLVRYADDFVITGNSKELLENEVKPIVESFLLTRGLELSFEKTKITHIEEGFDFLGQNVRKYNGKLLIKPSKKATKAFLAHVRETIKDNKASKQVNLIRKLNPIIRGWANYHRSVVAKVAFSRVDSLIWRALWQWAKRRHSTKSRSWIKKKYFHSVGSRNWVFRAPTDGILSDGSVGMLELVLAADTKIRRHRKIKGEANPFDPLWENYFEKRFSLKMQDDLKGKKFLFDLWHSQDGRCLVCHLPLTKESGWHVHHVIRKVDGGSNKKSNLVMLHPNCHTQVHCLGLEIVKPALS